MGMLEINEEILRLQKQTLEQMETIRLQNEQMIANNQRLIDANDTLIADLKAYKEREEKFQRELEAFLGVGGKPASSD